MLFSEVPIQSRPAQAAAAGFEVVETWWLPPSAHSAWAKAVSRHGLDVALVNCDCGEISAGERGFLNVPEMRTHTLSAFRGALAFARRVGAPRVNLLVGIARAKVPARQEFETVASVLAECGSAAADEGMIVVVEPLNDHDVPGYLLPDAATAARLIERVGAPSVRLLYDTYHAARAGNDVPAELRAYAGLIEHVQYADCPGRGMPGTGVIGVQDVIEALVEIDYSGSIGLECRAPAAAPEQFECVRQLRVPGLDPLGSG